MSAVLSNTALIFLLGYKVARLFKAASAILGL